MMNEGNDSGDHYGVAFIGTNVPCNSRGLSL